MQFIDLALQTKKESRITGTNTTVVGATGDWDRICGWVAQAWAELQAMHKWKWMRGTSTFDTTASVGSYTPTLAGAVDGSGTDNLAEWREKEFRIFLTATGVADEQWLTYMPYDEFKNLFLFGANRTNYSRPQFITINPADKSIILGPAPDDIYTVTGEYFKTPTTLTLDADTPDMPARFHWLIIYMAMMSAGADKNAPELYGRGETGRKQLLTALKRDQLPKFRRGKSLIR